MEENASGTNNGLRKLSTIQLLNFCLGFLVCNLRGK